MKMRVAELELMTLIAQHFERYAPEGMETLDRLTAATIAAGALSLITRTEHSGEPVNLALKNSFMVACGKLWDASVRETKVAKARGNAC